MKRILCCCLAFSMIPFIECSDMDGECMEPQLLVKETYCNYNNSTSLSMYTFNEVNIKDIYLHNGCGIDFDGQHHLNDTFYLECDTEVINSERAAKEIRRYTFYLDCEEVDLLRNESTTELDGLLKNSLVDSPEPDIFTDETASDDIEVFSDAHANSTELDVFRNEFTTEYYDKLEHIHTNLSKFDLSSNKSIDSYLSKEVNKNSTGSKTALTILGYSVAALGAIVGLAFAAYKLKNSLQSGSYLLPDTQSSPVFTELA